MTTVARALLTALSLWMAGMATAQPQADAAAEVLQPTLWQQVVQAVQTQAREPIAADDMAQRCRARLVRQPALRGTLAQEACVQAALEGLGRNARYIAARERVVRNSGAPLAPASIGISLRKAELSGAMDVVEVLNGGPAARAGIRAGDQLLLIDGVLTSPMLLSDAVAALRGPAGSSVRLSVLRQGQAWPDAVAVQRQPARAPTVQAHWLQTGVAYVRITAFQPDTPDELLKQLDALSPAVPRLVLDLRANSGGLLSTTVALGSLFVPAGAEVLRVTDRSPAASRTYRAKAADLGGGLNVPAPSRAPLGPQGVVVLVDHGTAAGAEALAQLLREQRGAPLVGRTTQGHGRISTVLPLSGNAAISLPTGAMQSPRGHDWDGAGLQPDVTAGTTDPSPSSFGRLPGDQVLARALELVRP